mgnify:CR=1 FL=1
MENLILASAAEVPMSKKDKVYTDQQRLFLDALPSCKGNIRAAMNIAGYSENTPERYMIEALHEEMVEIANKLLAANSIKAAQGLVDVIDNEGKSLGASNVINAAKQILDRAGVVQKDASVNVKVGGGLLILPAKKESDDDGED